MIHPIIISKVLKFEIINYSILHNIQLLIESEVDETVRFKDLDKVCFTLLG